MKYVVAILSVLFINACVTTSSLRPDYLQYENSCVVKKDIAACNVCIETNPKGAQCLVSRGTLYFNVKKFDEAVKDLNAALVLEPKLAVARNNLGAIAYIKGEYKLAAEHYLAAIAIEPDYADARMGAGLSFFRQAAESLRIEDAVAKLKLAAEHLTRLLAIDPNYPDAAKALKRINGYLEQLS